jgi:hypothetical protein
VNKLEMAVICKIAVAGIVGNKCASMVGRYLTSAWTDLL